jgi:cell shape-determining protein MreC
MHKRKARLSSFSSIIFVPIVFIVILIDKPDYRFFDLAHRAFVPTVQYAGQFFSYPIRLVGGFAEKIRQRNMNLRDNEMIMAELDKVSNLTLEVRYLRLENEALRGRLSMAREIKFDTVSANIVRNNSFGERQSYIIRNPIGRIEVGNILVSNDGFFLGLISEVTGSFARVRSAKDGNFNIPVRFAGTDVFGFLYGRGNEDPELRFLSNDNFVPEAGSFLVTSSVNGNIPNNIPVGDVKSAAGGVIRVRLGADISKQNSVLVLLFNSGKIYDEDAGEK